MASVCLAALERNEVVPLGCSACAFDEGSCTFSKREHTHRCGRCGNVDHPDTPNEPLCGAVAPITLTKDGTPVVCAKGRHSDVWHVWNGSDGSHAVSVRWVAP